MKETIHILEDGRIVSHFMYQIAMAASMDYADRSMRAAGRIAWSDEDFALACATFNRIMGITP